MTTAPGMPEDRPALSADRPPEASQGLLDGVVRDTDALARLCPDAPRGPARTQAPPSGEDPRDPARCRDAEGEP